MPGRAYGSARGAWKRFSPGSPAARAAKAATAAWFLTSLYAASLRLGLGLGLG